METGITEFGEGQEFQQGTMAYCLPSKAAIFCWRIYLRSVVILGDFRPYLEIDNYRPNPILHSGIYFWVQDYTVTLFHILTRNVIFSGMAMPCLQRSLLPPLREGRTNHFSIQALRGRPGHFIRCCLPRRRPFFPHIWEVYHLGDHSTVITAQDELPKRGLLLKFLITYLYRQCRLRLFQAWRIQLPLQQQWVPGKCETSKHLIFKN